MKTRELIFAFIVGFWSGLEIMPLFVHVLYIAMIVLSFYIGRFN